MARLEIDPHAYKREDRANKLRGVYLAIVTANLDEGSDSKYKLKLKFPWLPGEEDSAWARIAIPMAGKERGTYYLPEVDDQVLVVFEHGDISKPIVIGAIFNDKQQPPENNADGKNDLRVIKSKTGHRVCLDDKDGSERITIYDGSGKNIFLFDSKEDSVTIQASEGDIEITASSGAVRMHGKAIKLTTKDKYTAKGSQLIEVKANATLDVNASSDLKAEASVVQINMGP